MIREDVLVRIIKSSLDVAQHNRNPLQLEKHACATLVMKPHTEIDSTKWDVESPKRGGKVVKVLNSVEEVYDHVYDLVFKQSYRIVCHPIKVMFTERASGKVVYKNKDGELTRGLRDCYFIVGSLDLKTCNDTFYSEFIPTYETYHEAPSQEALELYMTLQDDVEFGVTVEEFEKGGVS